MKLKLNNDIGIDLDTLIQSRMVVLANSGGGKSWAVRRLAEQAVDHVQVIIIDPEGEFASLREKYDFILCGKDADVPVETRSAALLATKLLEIGKSAIIDLYELSKQDRQRFVKIFFNTMVDAPKHLYHPVIVILDEAHDYAPEGKPSEATQAVEDLASKGRKRGYCLIPASQRIAKLSKNLTAECNNKLIGRATQDIDYIRAGAELGFGKADSAVKMRSLKPGDFFTFGPAISDEIIRVTIGAVKTTHNKVGYKKSAKIPPASAVIKKILGELKDLPQEAEKEAKTVQEFKQQIVQLKKDLKIEQERKVNLGKDIIDLDAIDRVVANRDAEWEEKIKKFITNNDEWRTHANDLEEAIQEAFKVLETSLRLKAPLADSSMHTIKHFQVDPKIFKKMDFKFKVNITNDPKPTPDDKPLHSGVHDGGFEARTLGKCARAIASYLYINQFQTPRTKTQVAVAVGYSQNSGGFNNAISELSSMGLISRGDGHLVANNQILAPELKIDIDTSLEKWSNKLSPCARKIWELLLQDSLTQHWDKAIIANNTGYSVTSGGFNNSISELSALGLIERHQGMIRINPEILNL